MRKYYYMICLLIGSASLPVLAQDVNHTSSLVDTASIASGWLGKGRKIPSVQTDRYQHKADSVRKKVSLHRLFAKKKNQVDSLHTRTTLQDTAVDNRKQEIDSLKKSFRLKMDSVQARTQDPLALKHKQDSITAVYDAALQKKIKLLKKVGVKLPKGAGRIADKTLLASKIPSLPGPQIPDQNIPTLPDGKNLNMPDADVSEKLPAGQLPDMNAISPDKLVRPAMPDDLNKVTDKIGDLATKKKRAGNLAKDAERLKSEGINSEEAKASTVRKLPMPLKTG
jgi:hypothetical protein